MKNLRNSLLLLFALIAFGQTAWAQFSGGTGTANDPYQISTEADWSTLCDNVNNNSSTYSGKFFKMTADISVSENFSSAPTKMVGRGENVNFRGTFDGNGHTLTVNYTDNHNERACAPFRYIRNATIKNLHVAGSITKQYNKNAGGLVGVAFGTCHIINCRSSVEITCHESDCSSGGFIGKLGTSSDSDDTYIDNCLFDGKLEGPSSHAWGGFIGWVEDEPDAYISNCLFNPEHVYINSEGTKTFARGSDIHITNCYHTYTLVDAQGSTKAKDMDREILRMKLGETWEHIGDKVQPALKPYALTGEGTEQLPYLIASVEDWNKLATNVYLGESYNDAYFQMTENISVGRGVGYHPGGDTYNTFRGTFDGDGHTLTFNYTTDAEFCGPFCYTYGATIKNLRTAGTINTSSKHAGGVVGRNGTGRLTLENVTSSVTINSTHRGSAEHGGLVGYAINADIIGCAFTGSILGENSNGCGGLIGWKTNTDNSSANITNCLFAPASVTVGTTNAYTLARNSSGGVVNVTNSYYTQALGTAQGKLAHSITAGEFVAMENAGTPTPYGISGIVSYGVGIKFNDVLYAGMGDVVSLNLGYTWTDEFEANGFNASAGTLGGNDNPYTLTMPDEDVLVYTNINDNPWDGQGTATSPYLISYATQWYLLAKGVAEGTNYSGIYFRLANDITVTTMVGTDDQHVFSGNFDGYGHKLTLDYNTTADYAAPFRFVDGATIHDLTVDGTIHTSKQFAAGLIGQAAGTVAIDHCRSSVSITSTVNGDGTDAGFVANIIAGQTTINGCLFDGRLLGSLTYNNGGFVGWTANDASLTLENSIFDPTEVTMVGDKTFARSSYDNQPTITNCFYTETFGVVQGKRIHKTQQEVADNGLYYTLTAFDKTYYGKVIVTMQVNFDQTNAHFTPVPTVMTEDGILIPQEGNYTLTWSQENDTYTVTITAEASNQFPIPNAQLIGSKTFEYNVVSIYAPKDLTATTTTTTATLSWTGTADSYKVRYRPTTLNTTYYTGFEYGLNDWTTIDNDGDGNCWKAMENLQELAHNGEAYMGSASYDNNVGVLIPDNWLVSPLLPLNGVLKVWMKGQDPNDFQEHVAIYVSTTGNALADFTDIVLPETIVTNEYVEYSVNLSQYAEAQGYIAIRHFNCTDQYYLNVDDFGLYVANSPSDEWQEIEVEGTSAVITGLQPGSYYAYQVVGLVGEETYPSAIAVMRTEEDVPEATQVSVAPQQTTAQVNWEGYGNSFNVRYAVDLGSPTTARVTLTAGDVWEDGSGYQMLLDADANTFGSVIPFGSPLSNSGDVSADVYAEFEYKIPENADGALNTQNIVFNNSVTIDIPAGTYDWCITNPSPDENVMFIASSHGNIGGRRDDYVFEAGKHYEFNVGLDGDYDRVDVMVSPIYGEWTQVEVENGAFTTELTGLTKNTKYVVQVQAVLANGQTSEWSPAEEFTTLNDNQIALYVEGYGTGEGAWKMIASPVAESIAPTAVSGLIADPATDYDLYRFNQSAKLEWENYKNAAHTDDFQLVNGMGYLYASKEATTLLFTGDFNTDATKTITGLQAGYNLVGNPFTVNATIDKSYYTLDETGSIVVATSVSGTTAIAPCTGVIVQSDSDNGSVTFTAVQQQNAVNTNNNGHLHITLSQEDTGRGTTGRKTLMDNAIVSFNEGSQLGKFYFGEQNANIYLPQGGEDYAIAYSDKQGEMPLNFKANENGTYTLTINPEGVEVGYLHLIDNMTGADVDLLANPSYSFNAKVTDYESRFKLVFAAADEADGEPSEAFAFISDGNLIVNGTGTLQVIDLLGRQLSSQEIHSSFSIQHSSFPSGVYVLRLINGDDVKTQKIIIR